jgi:3-oxoacyl-[acyl-carrier protein] reductase
VITLDFSGKTVLVIGGSSGIGLATAHMFESAGARVVVTGTRSSAADYADDLSGLDFRRLDTGDRAAVATFDPGFDRLDVLVNAAGMVMYRRAEFEVANFEQVLGVNLTGLFQLCEKFRLQLAQTTGSIVNVGSVASHRGIVAQPAYSASKGGLLTLTKSLALAYAKDGIRVNQVSPGLVRTKLTEVTWTDDERRAATERAIPLRRIGEPNDIAGAILFLASPLASYITGEAIIIDGGQTA